MHAKPEPSCSTFLMSSNPQEDLLCFFLNPIVGAGPLESLPLNSHSAWLFTAFGIFDTKKDFSFLVLFSLDLEKNALGGHWVATREGANSWFTLECLPVPFGFRNGLDQSPSLLVWTVFFLGSHMLVHGPSASCFTLSQMVRALGLVWPGIGSNLRRCSSPRLKVTVFHLNSRIISRDLFLLCQKFLHSLKVPSR